MWNLTPADISLTLLRIAVGLFFINSGFHKLFSREVHEKFVGLEKKLGCYSKFTEWAIPTGELLGGLGLFFGALTVPASLGLILILGGAIYFDCWREVCNKHPRDMLDWIGKSLYEPEILYVLVLGYLAITDGGPISIDHFVLRYFHV